MLLKKLFRLFSVIVHVFWGAVQVIYKVNNQCSSEIPYIGDKSLWSNFWILLGLENISVDVCFTSPIPVENRTRKELSEQSQQQITHFLYEHSNDYCK